MNDEAGIVGHLISIKNHQRFNDGIFLVVGYEKKVFTTAINTKTTRSYYIFDRPFKNKFYKINEYDLLNQIIYEKVKVIE